MGHGLYSKLLELEAVRVLENGLRPLGFENPPPKGLRGKLRPRDEPHQRPEAPRCRRSQEMQSGQRSFETRTEAWITVDEI